MKFNKPGEGGSFEPCPEYTGKAVCVDVTPPETVDTEWGKKEKFRLVFEVDAAREDGSPFCVWSKAFTVSLHAKAEIRKFLRGWLGRDLTNQEIESFASSETAFEEFCLGRGAFVVVTHTDATDGSGKVYANIMACTPDKSGDPLKPSGKFVRKKDREAQGNGNGGAGAGSSYRKAEQPTGADGETVGRDNWMRVKVHVGKHAGVEIGDLDPEAIERLKTHWLPVFAQMDKPKAADKRLADAIKIALEEMAAMQAGNDEGEVLF